MKLVIILTIIFITFTNCETRSGKKNSSKFNELYTLYFIGDVYVFKNICPPATVFDPGTYDISLEKGEALYFDISARLNAERTFHEYNYFIGVSNDIVSSEIAMNGLFSCNQNRTFSNPKPILSAQDESYLIEQTDSGFNYYRYYLSKSETMIFTAKALNASIQFKLKVPATGEELGY